MSYGASIDPNDPRFRLFEKEWAQPFPGEENRQPSLRLSNKGKREAVWGIQALNDAREAYKATAFYDNNDFDLDPSLRVGLVSRGISYLGCRVVSVLAVPLNAVSFFASLVAAIFTFPITNYFSNRVQGSARQFALSLGELPVIGELKLLFQCCCGSRRESRGYEVHQAEQRLVADET